MRNIVQYEIVAKCFNYCLCQRQINKRDCILTKVVYDFYDTLFDFEDRLEKCLVCIKKSGRHYDLKELQDVSKYCSPSIPNCKNHKRLNFLECDSKQKMCNIEHVDQRQYNINMPSFQNQEELEILIHKVQDSISKNFITPVHDKKLLLFQFRCPSLSDFTYVIYHDHVLHDMCKKKQYEFIPRLVMGNNVGDKVVAIGKVKNEDTNVAPLNLPFQKLTKTSCFDENERVQLYLSSNFNNYKLHLRYRMGLSKYEVSELMCKYFEQFMKCLQNVYNAREIVPFDCEDIVKMEPSTCKEYIVEIEKKQKKRSNDSDVTWESDEGFSKVSSNSSGNEMVPKVINLFQGVITFCIPTLTFEEISKICLEMKGLVCKEELIKCMITSNLLQSRTIIYINDYECKDLEHVKIRYLSFRYSQNIKLGLTNEREIISETPSKCFFQIPTQFFHLEN